MPLGHCLFILVLWASRPGACTANQLRSPHSRDGMLARTSGPASPRCGGCRCAGSGSSGSIVSPLLVRHCRPLSLASVSRREGPAHPPLGRPHAQAPSELDACTPGMRSVTNLTVSTFAAHRTEHAPAHRGPAKTSPPLLFPAEPLPAWGALPAFPT